MRLRICVPSNRDQSPLFTASLVALVQNHCINGVMGAKLEDLRVAIKYGVSNIADARNDFVGEAISQGFTHVLFLDDDMTFPFDLVSALNRWGKPVITTNYCKKDPGRLIYTAIGVDKKVVDSKGKTGLCQVLRAGTGTMLIELSAISGIPAPWFANVRDSNDNKVITDDYYFCDLLTKHGIPIYIDHKLSHFIGHIGAHVYQYSSYSDV